MVVLLAGLRNSEAIACQELARTCRQLIEATPFMLPDPYKGAVFVNKCCSDIVQCRFHSTARQTRRSDH